MNPVEPAKPKCPYTPPADPIVAQLERWVLDQRLDEILGESRRAHPDWNAGQVLQDLVARGELLPCDCGGYWVRIPGRRT